MPETLGNVFLVGGQNLNQGGAEFIEAGGFLQHAVGAVGLVNPVEEAGGVAAGGEDEDRGREAAAADLPMHGAAIEVAGEVLIEQQQVGAMPLQEFEGVGAIGGFPDDLAAQARAEFAEAPAGGRMIIANEDALALALRLHL